MVIANEDFFYREYAGPRRELEKAGIRVTVAAGRKSSCRPHPGTGEGTDGGVINPDLALSDIKADQFDAILFSAAGELPPISLRSPGDTTKLPTTEIGALERKRIGSSMSSSNRTNTSARCVTGYPSWRGLELRGRAHWMESEFARQFVRQLPESTTVAVFSHHVCGIPK